MLRVGNFASAIENALGCGIASLATWEAEGVALLRSPLGWLEGDGIAALATNGGTACWSFGAVALGRLASLEALLGGALRRVALCGLPLHWGG